MLSSSKFHTDFKSLIVSTQEIGIMGLKLEQEIKPLALTNLLAEEDQTFSWIAKDPTLVTFSIERENAHAFIVHVEASLLLHCACVRCLKIVPFRFPLTFSIRMIEDEEKHLREHEPGELTLDSDSLIDENDYLVGYFSKKAIDLGLILREQIFLEVPDYPKCGGKWAIEKNACEIRLIESEEESVRENPFIKLFKKN